MKRLKCFLGFLKLLLYKLELAVSGYEIHRPERVPREEGHKGTTTDASADGGGGGFKVIYYSDSFFESNFFPSHGDIILLYPGSNNNHCDIFLKIKIIKIGIQTSGNGFCELGALRP